MAFTRLRAVALSATIATLVAAPGAAAFEAGSTTLLSRPSGLAALPAPGMTEPNLLDALRQAEMTPDGRYVVFTSGADGLASDDDDEAVYVWLRDRQANTTTRVAKKVASTVAGLRENVDVSDDGDRVCFSTAEPLAAGDTDAAGDVYVKDLSDGSVTWASRPSGGGDAGGTAELCAMSGDGAHVVFTSSSQLVPDDANAKIDVHRFTMASAATILVSRADGAAGAIGAGDSRSPDVSFDGDVVVFSTVVAGLDGPDANGSEADVMARRVSTHDTRAVSTVDGSSTQEAEGPSGAPTVSRNGDEVAFTSSAVDLAPGDATNDTDVFRKRLSTAQTVLVSRASGSGGAGSNGEDADPRISGDGTAVAFESRATNLHAGAPDVATRVYVRSGIDGASPATEIASRAAGAAGSPARFAYVQALTSDGGRVLFQTSSRGLVADGAGDFDQLFVRGLTSPFAVEPVIRPSGAPGPFPGLQNDAAALISRRTMSDDGRFVAFVSSADGLAADDDDATQQAFVRDTLLHETILVSRATGAAGAPADHETNAIVISGDGRRVAFTSEATNLGGAAGSDPDDAALYVRDLVTKTTTLVSRATGPDGVRTNDNVLGHDIDHDGSRVAFATESTNLGGGTDDERDVFVRDLAAQTTVHASVSDTELEVSGHASAPTISADGNLVTFGASGASYGDGDTDAGGDIHLRDLAAGRTFWVSRPATGQSNGSSLGPSMSGDGQRIAFRTSATNLAPGDTDAQQDVHVRDMTAGTTVLASRATGAAGAKADAESDYPHLSTDGKTVTVDSAATNLAAGHDPAGRDVFVRRLDTEETVLASRSDGPSGTALRRVGTAATNGDGRCVSFTAEFAPGTPRPAGVSPDFRQMFMRTLSGQCPVPPPDDGDGGGDGEGDGDGTQNPAPAAPAAPTPTPTPPAPAGPLTPLPIGLPRPAPAPALSAAKVLKLPRACTSRRRFRIKLALPAGARVRTVAVTVNGKRAKSTRRGADVDLRGLPKGRIAVKITVVLADGRSVSTTRRYRTCTPRKRRG